MNLYDGSGNVIEIGGDTPTPVPVDFDGIANSTKSGKPHGARSNIVQTHGYDPNYSGDVRWMESGFLFKRTKPKTSFTFTWSINITGSATSIRVDCYGNSTVYVAHDYAGGEQTYTDTFSDATKLDSDYIRFYVTLATPTNTDNPTRIGTERTLKLAEIPDGLELVDEYVNRTPSITTHSFTYDEAKTFPTYLSRFAGMRYMAIGDSITGGNAHNAPQYHGVVGEVFKMDRVVNAGMGGSSLVQWAQSYIDSKWVYPYDLFTIMHGTNDHDNTPVSPLGSLAAHGSTFDKSTFIGAYQYVIETLLSKARSAEIILMKSIYKSSDNSVNSQGLKMSDYRAATQLVADSYGLPCFDASTAITAENYGVYLSDGIHPTKDGQEHLGLALADWMAAL